MVIFNNKMKFNRAINARYSNKITKLSFAISLAITATTVMATEKGETIPTTSLLLDSNSQQQEQQIRQQIRSVLKGDSGARSVISTNIEEISPRSAAMSAIEKALSIKQAGIDQNITTAVLQEAKALFDPVLSATAMYKWKKDYAREEWGNQWRKSTVHMDNGDTLTIGGETYTCSDAGAAGAVTVVAAATGCDVISFSSPQSPVSFIELDEARPAGNYWKKTVAHEDNPLWDKDDSLNYPFSLSQQFPWGQSLTLGLTLIDKDKYYTLNPDGKQAGFATYGSYNRPWSSKVKVNSFLPLPWTKRFGEFVGSNLTIKQANLQQEKGRWTVQRIINDVLLQVDLAFWELVKAQNELLAIIEGKKTASHMLEQAERLHASRMITDYDKAQAEVELEKLETQEESAWNRLVTASNTLSNLLNTEEDLLYLPSSYMTVLDATEDNAKLFDLNRYAKTELENNLNNNLELKEQSYNINMAELSLNGKKAAVRPDVNLSINLNFDQKNSTFGYKTIGDSLAHIANPDSISQAYSLAFNRQLGNDVAESDVGISAANLEVAGLQLQDTRRSVAHTIERAKIKLVSAKNQLKITKKNIQLAELALKKALQRQGTRMVTEYEVAKKNSSLVATKLAHVGAMIDVKQAESRLLAANGELTAQYGVRTAQTDMDEKRVSMLQKMQQFFFFGSETQNDDRQGDEG